MAPNHVHGNTAANNAIWSADWIKCMTKNSHQRVKFLKISDFLSLFPSFVKAVLMQKQDKITKKTPRNRLNNIVT